MALLTNPQVVGYNVQEICNQLGSVASNVAEGNCIHQVAADAAAGTTTAETAIAYFKTGQTVARLVIVPTGAATANDTNYATITVAKRDGAGGAATTIATLVTTVAGGSWTAFVPKSMGAITSGALADGSVLTYTVAKAASGVQLPAFKLYAELA